MPLYYSVILRLISLKLIVNIPMNIEAWKYPIKNVDTFLTKETATGSLSRVY